MLDAALADRDESEPRSPASEVEGTPPSNGAPLSTIALCSYRFRDHWNRREHRGRSPALAAAEGHRPGLMTFDRWDLIVGFSLGLAVYVLVKIYYGIA